MGNETPAMKATAADLETDRLGIAPDDWLALV
jgi:hypothetical protein